MNTNTTFSLVVSTQVRENYGAHDWSGEGECPQYWKMKGGNEITILEGLSVWEVVNYSLGKGVPTFAMIVDQWEKDNLGCDDYFDEYVIDFELVEVSQSTIQEGIDAIKAEYAERWEGGPRNFQQMVENDWGYSELKYGVIYDPAYSLTETILGCARKVLLEQLSKEAA